VHNGVCILVMRRITFGVRNHPIQKGFVKYLETAEQVGESRDSTVSRDLAINDPINFIKNKRIAEALLRIIEENSDDDLLVMDDDVFLGGVGMRYEFERLKHLTYIAFGHKVKGHETTGVIASGTCFFLPKNDMQAFSDALRMFNHPNQNVDVFVDTHLPSGMIKQLIFLDGTTHIFSNELYLELNVTASNGAFLLPTNSLVEVGVAHARGYYTIEEHSRNP
jgi:glycosyltransferase involved in cell wall biosynthesis